MIKTERIERRVALAFLILGSVITLTLGGSLMLSLRLVEAEMLDNILHSELDYFRANAQSQGNAVFETSRTKVYSASLNQLNSLPPPLRSLASGVHRVSIDGREYRVLIEDTPAVRYVVRFDDTFLREREEEFLLLVGLVVLVALLVSVFVGWIFASRLTEPIRHLVDQMRGLRNDANARLDLADYRRDEIGELAHALNDYHMQIKSLLQREKEFAGNVSHELRTPVTNISLAAEVLASQESLPQKDLERVSRIQRAAREVAELIDTFLVLAKISESNTDVDEATNVGPVVRQVVADQRVWLGNKPVEVIIKIDDEFFVAAPRAILAVLVANLVRNAFRYTPEGLVSITVGYGKITVRDTGPGIEPHTQNRLFERHERGNGELDGAGLGLAIVQRICERYAWQISLQSAPGRGSQFDVKFPADQVRTTEDGDRD